MNHIGSVIRNNRVRGLKFLTFAILMLAVSGLVVMYLWNWLIPAIFGLQPITFWQAAGLLLLSRILFGGFRGSPGGGRRHQRHFLRRWAEMTPEEREQLLRGIRQTHGSSNPSPSKS
jgi:hypothetical protein